MFLKHFYVDMWLENQKKNPETLMQFNVLFEELKKKIRSVFENYTIGSFH